MSSIGHCYGRTWMEPYEVEPASSSRSSERNSAVPPLSSFRIDPYEVEPASSSRSYECNNSSERRYTYISVSNLFVELDPIGPTSLDECRGKLNFPVERECMAEYDLIKLLPNSALNVAIARVAALAKKLALNIIDGRKAQGDRNTYIEVDSQGRKWQHWEYESLNEVSIILLKQTRALANNLLHSEIALIEDSQSVNTPPNRRRNVQEVAKVQELKERVKSALERVDTLIRSNDYMLSSDNSEFHDIKRKLDTIHERLQKPIVFKPNRKGWRVWGFGHLAK